MSLAHVSRTVLRRALVLAVVLVPALLFAPEAEAQFLRKWLSVGELHHRYAESGGEYIPGPTEHDLMYPGINHLGSHTSGLGNWFSVVDWTDETGETWPVKTVHAGPDQPGEGEVFPVELTVVSRFEPPTVLVDGFESFDKYVRNEEVDPNLPAERMLRNVVNTAVGVTMERRIMQFSNECHDNYHLIEHTFTNTGNVDGDDEIELPDQTIEGFYFFPIQNYADEEAAKVRNYGGNRWGRDHMTDVIGDGNEDYEEDFRAIYSWLGYSPRIQNFNMLGSPILFDNDAEVMEGDTLGRLSSAYFIGRVTLHADRSASDPSDDPTQPSTNTYFDWDRTELRAPRPFDAQQMQAIRQEWIEAGQVYPHHADLVTGVTGPWDRDRFARQTQDPGQGLTGGFTTAQGYGPYDLAPGESIEIDIAEGFAGLSEEAAAAVGLGYKRAWQAGDDFREIPYDADGDGVIEDDERMSKQHWVMTSRDSVLQMFERAMENYQSGYDIPQPPRPPERFAVTSGVDRIDLEWQLYPEADESRIAGYELYRGRLTARGSPDDSYIYQQIAGVDELPVGTTSYQDTDVERGVPYYYYLQVVAEDDVAPDAPAECNPLKSNRYWTQTYDPAILVRDEGESLEAARVVPNPLYLGSTKEVRWPDRQYRVAFLEIPGNSTISIYTEIGELVRRIEHTTGSGDEYWDLTTSSNQIVVSGVYLVVIEDNDTGDQVVRKLIVVR